MITKEAEPDELWAEINDLSNTIETYSDWLAIVKSRFDIQPKGHQEASVVKGSEKKQRSLLEEEALKLYPISIVQLIGDMDQVLITDENLRIRNEWIEQQLSTKGTEASTGQAGATVEDDWVRVEDVLEWIYKNNWQVAFYKDEPMYYQLYKDGEANKIRYAKPNELFALYVTSPEGISKSKSPTDKVEEEYVEDLQVQVRRAIKEHDLFDWHEALSENEMTYLENLLLTWSPKLPAGSVGNPYSIKEEIKRHSDTWEEAVAHTKEDNSAMNKTAYLEQLENKLRKQ